MINGNLDKRILLIAGFFIASSAYAFKPSECPRFLEGKIKDTLLMDELIGSIFMFDKQKDANGILQDSYSKMCYYVQPDTIIVHHKKRNMKEGIDFFILNQYGAKLTCRERKNYYTEYKDFNPATYNEKDFRKYEFQIKIDNGKINNLYFKKMRLLAIDSHVFVFEDVATKEKVLLNPIKYYSQDEYYAKPITLIPCDLVHTIDHFFPVTLYKKYSYFDNYTKAKTTVSLTIVNNYANVNIDVLYKQYFSSRSIIELPDLITKEELDSYKRVHSINYHVNSLYKIDSVLLKDIAGIGCTGILLQHKGGYVAQKVSEGQLQDKIYLKECLVWFGGVDTILNSIYYKVCEHDKVFYIEEKNISLKYESVGERVEDVTEAINRYKSKSRIDQEAYFEYTKRYVCYDLFLAEQKEYTDYLNKYKKLGILVENMRLYDNYGVSTGFAFEVTNLSPKVIKYLEVCVTGLNAVRDKIYEKGNAIQTATCVGPINSYETASYNFEHLWWTDLVAYYNVNNYVITYMDGTSKKLKANEDPRKSLFLAMLEDNLNFLPDLKKHVY